MTFLYYTHVLIAVQKQIIKKINVFIEQLLYKTMLKIGYWICLWYYMIYLSIYLSIDINVDIDIYGFLYYWTCLVRKSYIIY